MVNAKPVYCSTYDEFVCNFSQNSDIERDAIDEFISIVSGVSGIQLTLSDNELNFIFTLDDIFFCPILTFTAKNGRADIFVDKTRLNAFLDNHRVLPTIAAAFLRFYHAYDRIIHIPDLKSNRIYGNVYEIIYSPVEFADALDAFVLQINE